MQKTANGNWPLYLAWFGILTATLCISMVSRVESTSFLGIAETREIIVNSENAVDIRKIAVTEGQAVEKGTLLVGLSSPELELTINHISHQLDQLKVQKGVDKVELQSRLRQLKAEKTARETEIKNQIAEFENQLSINKSLFSGLKSISGSRVNKVPLDENSPIRLKIMGLEKELNLSVSSIAIQIELIQQTLQSSEDPVKIQVERLEKELALLKTERNQLDIYAQISGIIGSVNYKQGEKVSPFASILTLHTRNPSFIKGYIYENAYARVAMGDKVHVASFAGADISINGQVVGVGARIVEYPIRLRKHPDIQSWGREVVIRISEANPFILGEKVLITSIYREKGFVDKVKSLFSLSESVAETLK